MYRDGRRQANEVGRERRAQVKWEIGGKRLIEVLGSCSVSPTGQSSG